MGTGTGIGRVRGLGSARHGASHWLAQRVTAAGNLLLGIWFLVSLARLPSLDHATITAWIASPLVAVPLILLAVSVFWHLRLGLQVFIEDYAHEEGAKIVLLLLNTFYAVGGAALAIVSIIRIALAGAAA
jgi:succinate dehydrogenase / fumarate reductase membrane anchor subunit